MVLERIGDLTGDCEADDARCQELLASDPAAPDGSVPEDIRRHLIRDIGPTLGGWAYLVVGLLAFLETAALIGLDRLAALGFAKRKPEPDDRRGIEVQRTVKGAVYLRAFGAGIAVCAREVAENPLGIATLAAIGRAEPKP